MPALRTPADRLRKAMWGALLCLAVLGAACTSSKTETGQDFLAGGHARVLSQREMEPRLAGALMDMRVDRPFKRFWHGSDGELIDIGHAPGSRFSQGRWFFRSAVKYCTEVYVGAGSVGSCGTFYERNGHLYLVTDGTGTRKHLWSITLTKMPKPAS